MSVTPIFFAFLTLVAHYLTAVKKKKIKKIYRLKHSRANEKDLSSGLSLSLPSHEYVR